MGIAIPQVITSDRATGAQIIDGSLKFDSGAKNRIDRDATTAGSGTTWTLALWAKKQGNDCHVFGAGDASTDRFGFGFNGSDKIFAFVIDSNSTVFSITTSAVFRDNGWYHIVLVADTTDGTQADRFKVYVNGVLQTVSGTLMPSSQDTNVNSAVTHTFGRRSYTDSDHFNGQITNAYLIDGQALEPTDFGFTDPLTNTWKPKKYTRGVFEELDKFNTYTWGETQNQLRYQGIKFPSSAGGTVAWKATGSSNTGLNLYTSTDNSTWTRRLTNQTVDSTNGLVYESSDQYVILVNGTDANWSNQLQLFSDVNGATIHYSNATYPGNGSPTMSWSGPGYTDGTIASYNSFYLPFDGNSPIGQDKSGNGNDWTPVNFGGSVALDNPQVSGARPILNTTPGGTQAGVGIFGSRENVGYAVTVYDDGGGNKYYIDGVKQATLNGLIRGATYTFDTSDSTVSSHPFRFSESDGGSEYTNGVVAITGAATTITIPYNSSNELYYYCTSHSGMGSSITGITTNEKLADQYASNCTLALPLVGNDDDVCASIACTARNKTPTNSSVTASSTQSNFYTGSHHWSAKSDTLQYAQQGDELVFGQGDFTIEFWYFDDGGHSGTNGRTYLFDNRIGGSVTGDPPTMAGWLDGAEVNLYIANGGGTISYDGSTENKWHHYAAVRSGTTVTLYFDGVSRGTMTSSTNFTNNGIGVGRATDANYGFAGYMQDFRVYKGIAKYTSDFVIPATSPDILPDTPSGVSGGSKLTISPYTSTEGAVVFDGDSDYLSSTGPGTLAASSNWCMECTFYCTGTSSGTYRIMGANESSESSEYLQMRIRNGQYQFYTENANTLTGTAAFNKWTHMALTKSGTTVRAFVDGKELWSTTDNNADDITTLITGWGYGSEYFPGFISNARFVNGSSVYTSEFNPPVVPLTNITNTTHLFCQSNTSATAAAVGTITANGTAAASRFTPFNTDINTVRGQETGYATWNPLSNGTNAISDGNLTLGVDSSSGNSRVNCTMSVSSGKWYYECYVLGSGSNYNSFGVSVGPEITNQFPGRDANSWSFEFGEAKGKHNNSYTSSAYTAIAAGDTFMCAFDVDTKKLWFGRNGVWQVGDPGSGTNAFYDISDATYSDYRPAGRPYGSGSLVRTNFGQKPFKFPPPDGFQPLNAANARLETVISRPDQYVGIVTYTGNGTTGQSIKGLNFDANPDLVWIKSRSFSNNHHLFDTVRGPNKIIRSSTTDTEDSSKAVMPSFDFNGFSVDEVTGNNATNNNAHSFVAWCWKAGGNKNTFNIDYVGYSTAGDVNMEVGDLNSVSFDKSQTWTNQVSGTENSSYPFSNMFNADGEATHAYPSNGTTATFTPSPSFSNAKTVKVWYYAPTINSNTFQLNGVNVGDQMTETSGTLTKTFNVDGFTSWSWSKGVDSDDSGMLRIDVDGVQLVDSGVTTPNVPSTAATGCSVGTKQGFSIIKYTGPNNTDNHSVPHGLSQEPDFIITKNLDDTYNWDIYHSSLADDKYLIFTTDDTRNQGFSGRPTSTVFKTEHDYSTDENDDYIAYLWHDVPGLQKFGSYTGNGSASGPFIELGFRPAVVWVKRSDGGTEPWAIYDSSRGPINPNPKGLYADDDASENDASGRYKDFLSNGFRVRGTSGEQNTNNATYIYCAWAEAPLVDLYGGGANAR